MKKHILCLILTVALLISLIPLGALQADAASEFVTGTEMIEILKKWEGFSPKPFWDYKQWTVGYGTSVPEGKLEEYKANGITEEEATQLLANSLRSGVIKSSGLTMPSSARPSESSCKSRFSAAATPVSAPSSFSERGRAALL